MRYILLLLYRFTAQEIKVRWLTDLPRKLVNEGCWDLTPDSLIQHLPFHALFITYLLVTLCK